MSYRLTLATVTVPSPTAVWTVTLQERWRDVQITNTAVFVLGLASGRVFVYSRVAGQLLGATSVSDGWSSGSLLGLRPSPADCVVGVWVNNASTSLLISVDLAGAITQLLNTSVSLSINLAGSPAVPFQLEVDPSSGCMYLAADSRGTSFFALSPTGTTTMERIVVFIWPCGSLTCST
jgi:hypothetical protein